MNKKSAQVARNFAQFNSPFRDGGKFLNCENLRFCRPDIENLAYQKKNLENSICQVYRKLDIWHVKH